MLKKKINYFGNQMKKSDDLNILSQFWIFFFPISSYFFYNYVGFNQQILSYIYITSLLITTFIVFPEIFKSQRNKIYSSLIRNIFLLMSFSMLMAYFFWGQSLDLSFKFTSSYLTIIFFFFLLKVKPNLDYIEKLIWLFTILYILIWLYSLMKAPVLTFGISNENGLDNERGIFRLHIPGRGFVILSFFMAINKFSETKKLKWLFIFILLFVIIVLHVTRQVIAFTFLFGLYYLIRNNKYLFLCLGFIGIISFGIINIKITDTSVIGKVISLSGDQIDDAKSGEENIRITEYKYFFFKYSKSFATKIFGNGVPHPKGNLGKMESNLNKNLSIYANDVGYGEIYIRFGLLGLVFYGLIFYRVIRQKIPEKYMFAKLFMLYLILANIAASWLFYDSIVICISLYILESCNNNQKKNILKKKKYNEIFNRNPGIQSKIYTRVHK